MQALKTRPGVHRGGILSLRVEDISPNPVQPRRHFDEAGLRELSDSIRSYGILNPLTVRLRCGKYELVAGERRLRAAKLAGLREVPCILIDVNMEDAGLLALVENLQRRDLDFLEEAEGLNKLIRMFGMRQEEAARRIGKSQSAVANKLRLLKLPPDVLETLREKQLSERHGRALLRLPDGESQRAALAAILEQGMTVEERNLPPCSAHFRSHISLVPPGSPSYTGLKIWSSVSSPPSLPLSNVPKSCLSFYHLLLLLSLFSCPVTSDSSQPHGLQHARPL